MIELRASELGSCIKRQVALLLGHKALPTPDRMQAAFDRGNEHEEANGSALLAEGWWIDSTAEGFPTDEGQVYVVMPITDDVQITGHLDGIISMDVVQPRRVWESKSPAAWAKFEKAYKTNDWSDPLAHRYAWQISVYMVATGLEAMVTCLDGDEVKSFVIEMSPFSDAEIRGRALDVAKAVASGTLPAICSQNDYPCPVAYLHDEPEYDDDPEMDRLVADYAMAGRMLKEWKAKQDRAKTRIEEQLGERESVETASSKVTRYEQAAAKKYDMVAIADALRVPLSDYLIPGAPSTRIKITSREDSNAEAE